MGSQSYVPMPSELTFYCASELCQAEMIFEITNDFYDFPRSGTKFYVVQYKCRHCKDTLKAILFYVVVENGRRSVVVRKVVEFPPSGPPIPKKLLRLVSGDSALLLKGYQLERSGFGVGAFSYYRQVVEARKNELLSEIKKVAVALQADSSVLDSIDNAIKNFKFTESIDKVKIAIPKELLIDGHNPLTLLHGALSEGLHGGTDEECLELATAVREVLIELSERADMILKEKDSLKTAVSRLANRSK